MQSGGGGGGGGNGRGSQQGGRPSSSSSASPSSSTSTPVHALGQHHLGLESFRQQQQQQQQQQQLAYVQAIHQQELQHRQHQQQQQQQFMRNSEGGNMHLNYQTGAPSGASSGGTFPASSASLHLSQQQVKTGDLPLQPNQSGVPQFLEENQNKGQTLGQQAHNQMHPAYVQFATIQAAQQKSQGNLISQQQHSKMSLPGTSARDQEIGSSGMTMQELIARQIATQQQASLFKRPSEHPAQVEKHGDQGQLANEHRNDARSPQITVGQHGPSPNVVRQPMQPMQPRQAVLGNTGNNQMQALQAWAKENNVDLTNPANMNLVAQLLPFWQSSMMAAVQKQNEATAGQQQINSPSTLQSSMPTQMGGETSASQGGPFKLRESLPSSSRSAGGESSTANVHGIQMQQHQLSAQRTENQNERVIRPPMAMGNGGQFFMHTTGVNQIQEPTNAKANFTNPETMPMQYLGPQSMINRVNAAAVPAVETTSSQQVIRDSPRSQTVFTKQQLYVLKAQILAFRRLKRGERLPAEVLEAILSPPADPPQQAPALPSVQNRDHTMTNNINDLVGQAENSEKAIDRSTLQKAHLPKEDLSAGDEKISNLSSMQAPAPLSGEPIRVSSSSKVEQSSSSMIKSEQERLNQSSSAKSDHPVERLSPARTDHGAGDSELAKKSSASSNIPSPQRDVPRKYHGPIFDFPSFTKKHDSGAANYSSNLVLGYDVKDLLHQEGLVVLKKKRADNVRKINGLLAINQERKRIKPDVVLRLQIEEKKLKLLQIQAHLRNEIEHDQQEIMAMPDRPYRKFVRQCERQRAELARQVQQLQKSMKEKQLKSIFMWRKKLLETHWAIRDARTTRNRGVAKYHEKMLREFSKRKDDDRNKRMEALKNNDVDRYREMLLEQQINVPGDAAQRYAVLSSFLSQTEEYLLKLGGKITAAKNHQEIEEAANSAAAAARSQGLSEEEVRAAAACAGQEVMIRKKFLEMNAPRESTSVNKYYNLAHIVNERVCRQPSMLRAGTLRDYQLVGLQWMLSLYNNKLNGILADEMGLGKTVQVMALIAYLMEFKGNYGPHLIIVPNAVLVNWKSELLNWLPSVSCIFYVGGKDQRAKLFSQEVCAMKFNVLVTTYEFVMYDKSRLSKIEWKYIIIDEAQRMKDRESVLARDLDRYRCQRRLLLTGTPLQNDLKELWSLLNLLLPEVFDNRKAFHDWFSTPFQRDGPSQEADEDDWLETEKKVIVIHRLHQILEPFMLRRRVEEVEGSLPPKESIVIRCRMSAMQGAIYDWIKSTGTIRIDPEDEKHRLAKNPLYQTKVFKNLNNKCMELRKVCNHPLLNYPYMSYYGRDFIIRSCGKLWILDRILMKLHRTGHRVLLFSTMTKLLDILEDYLQFRQLLYRRIDGTTSLEDRESAIVDFNGHDSQCFIFLLSIRAAGRGLNLQSADTVVIYDPDPNPQNEEQAVARAHRIGQTRAVKVIYLEAVVDKFSSYQKEDDFKNGGLGDTDEDLAGKDRYIGSIESLIRNNIQQYKIDMADEVINAGRFDQRTTHEERRMTLETMLHDEERYQETVHDVPSLQQVNRMIARSDEEVELFDQMDEDFDDWTEDMLRHHEVPKWMRVTSLDVESLVTSLSKKPSKNIFSGSANAEANGPHGDSPSKTEKRRGRPRAASSVHIYREVDDEDIEDSDDESDDANASSLPEEDHEIGEFEDEEYNDVHDNEDPIEEDGMINDDGTEDFSLPMEHGVINNRSDEAGSTGSSSGSRRLRLPAVPSMAAQKFGSLSALDGHPGSFPKQTLDDLEEGEIAMSGDSHIDAQQSGSWNHDRDDGEDEQVLQPKLKRKRSIRSRPRYNAERLDNSNGDRTFAGAARSFQANYDYNSQMKPETKTELLSPSSSGQHNLDDRSMVQKRNTPAKKNSTVPVQKSNRLSYLSGSAEGSSEQPKGSWSSKCTRSPSPGGMGVRMSDSMQRKCKNVISKLWRKINKDGLEIAPILSDWWRRNAKSNFSASSALDLQKIELRVDSSEYVGVSDFIADVQSMLRNVVRYFVNTSEVRHEAEKLHSIFFDIMKIAFPDSDFREAKNAVSFSAPGCGSASTSKQGQSSQSKRGGPRNEPEIPHSPSPVADGSNRAYPPKPGKREFKSSGGSTKLPVSDCSQLLTHPSDLVICKKKRKDREKPSMLRTGVGTSPSNSGRMGPLSPTTTSRLRPTSPPSTTRGTRTPTQQAVHPIGWVNQSSKPPQLDGIGDLKWAKPTKRMRTDSAKRRSSHF